MYKTFLVDTDIEEGRRVANELERRGFPISAAFWFHFEDDDWKLVIVSPEVSEKGPKQVYGTVSLALSALETDTHPLTFPLDRLQLVSPYNLTYKMVKQNAGPIGGPVREGPVLDAYIYKMS